MKIKKLLPVVLLAFFSSNVFFSFNVWSYQISDKVCPGQKYVKSASLSGDNYFNVMCQNGYKTTCWGSIIKMKFQWGCNSKDIFFPDPSTQKVVKTFYVQFKTLCDGVAQIGEPLCKKHL